MTLGERVTDERGSAVVEFLTLGIGLLVPLIYVVLAIGAIQGGWLLAHGLARNAVAVVTASDSSAEAERAVAAFVAISERAAKVDPDRVQLRIECGVPGDCVHAGVLIRARVSVAVPLPFLGGIAGDSGTVVLAAEESQRVPRFLGGAR